MCYSLWDLGVTYTVRLWLIERKFQGDGGRPPTTVGVRKLESLGYHAGRYLA